MQTPSVENKTVALDTGDAVTFVDEYGFERAAIVTANWGTKQYDPVDPKAQAPAINLAFVNPNPAMTDQYGRQMCRASSVTHRKHRGECPGRYWFKTEEDEIIASAKLV
jgi:hypothetical protein